MKKAPLQPLSGEEITGRRVAAQVLRTDLLHPHYGGNKWYKLKYNLEAAREAGYETVLTFGGAFSNHIAATAAAAAQHGFHSIGIIRGEEQETLNPTLHFARGQGMHLHYFSREKYRHKHETQTERELQALFGRFYSIPEGGSNVEGVRGCTEILSDIGAGFDTVMVACGTGSTLAGIALSLRPGQRAIGVPVFRNGHFLETEIRSQMAAFLERYPGGAWNQEPSLSLACDYHFGGYARQTPELFAFAAAFEKEHGIPLDFVYTSKLFYAFYDLLRLGAFRQDERILLVHTGGLQGNAGILARQEGSKD